MINSMTVLSILPSVKEINLSNNTIHKIAPNTFLGKKNLAKVHLERNRLETLDVSSLMVSLGPNDGELKINQIDEKFFNFDTILALFTERNLIFTLFFSSFRLEPPQFFMAGNPLVCNCHLQWFHQMASAQLHHPGLLSTTSLSSMNQLYPEVMDLDQVCTMIFDFKNNFT